MRRRRRRIRVRMSAKMTHQLKAQCYYYQIIYANDIIHFGANCFSINLVAFDYNDVIMQPIFTSTSGKIEKMNYSLKLIIRSSDWSATFHTRMPVHEKTLRKKNRYESDMLVLLWLLETI